MEQGDIERIRDSLTRAAGLSDIYSEVARFKCVRKDKAGETRDVIIEILDAGPKAMRETRFTVWAFDESGRIALGNGGGTIDEAIDVVQWHKLDTDAYAKDPGWKAMF